jgi:beta-glucosidase
VSVTVRNAGTRAGKEIVQLYLTDPVASVVRPVKQLRGFHKVSLAAGEERSVSFTLTTSDLEFHDAKLRRVWEPGKFIVGIGPSSDDVQTIEVRWNKHQVAAQ